MTRKIPPFLHFIEFLYSVSVGVIFREKITAKHDLPQFGNQKEKTKLFKNLSVIRSDRVGDIINF